MRKNDEWILSAYAGYIDENDIMKSTSGGVATALAKHVIQKGGYVAGVRYSNDFYEAEYFLTNKLDSIEQFRGSKYIDANVNNIFYDIELLLRKKKQVLFIGLPCIVAALRFYLKMEYSNLFTCELICHGTMPKEVHKSYLNFLEKKFNSKITFFSTRYKKDSWLPPYIHVEFENGHVYEKNFYGSEYEYAFSIVGKKCCYNCKFKAENHVGDILIGDFWGADRNDIFWNDKGISSIIVITQQGEKILKECSSLKLFESGKKRIIQSNPMIIMSRSRKKEAEKFLMLLRKKGFMYAVRRCKTLKEKIKNIIPQKFITIIKNRNIL